MQNGRGAGAQLYNTEEAYIKQQAIESRQQTGDRGGSRGETLIANQNRSRGTFPTYIFKQTHNQKKHQTADISQQTADISQQTAVNSQQTTDTRHQI
jgi:hypothetical protein